MRFCASIGLFAIDRPKTSCRHATNFCAARCYNKKLYALYPMMLLKDAKNEDYWQSLTGESLSREMARKSKSTNRVRLMTRGEAFSCPADIDKVADITCKNPTTMFWIPTHAWREPQLREALETTIAPIKNVRLQASVDPSNTPGEVKSLRRSGWKIMAFGWGSKQEMESALSIDGAKDCPKTAKHKIGACATCKGRCFAKAQTVVFLDQH